jgi:hypothetical protein
MTPTGILWSDIWDLIVMEIDELRSIIPPRVKPTLYFSIFRIDPQQMKQVPSLDV